MQGRVTVGLRDLHPSEMTGDPRRTSLQMPVNADAGLPPDEDTPVFPSSRGGRLSADALQRLVTRHSIAARSNCPSLAEKKVTPHTLRHTTAMDLLRRGVDLTVIALWLGHESTETVRIYLHADMRLKKQALAHATTSGLIPATYEPDDTLLAFLDGL